MVEPGEVTRLLREINLGDKEALNRLIPLLYDELHRLARGCFRRERREHFSPQLWVHEAYFRLMDQHAPIAYRGENAKAFGSLRQAFRLHDPALTEIKTDPLLNSLRGDPRYKVLLNKVGLPM